MDSLPGFGASGDFGATSTVVTLDPVMLKATLGVVIGSMIAYFLIRTWQKRKEIYRRWLNFTQRFIYALQWRPHWYHQLKKGWNQAKKAKQTMQVKKQIALRDEKTIVATVLSDALQKAVHNELLIPEQAEKYHVLLAQKLGLYDLKTEERKLVFRSTDPKDPKAIAALKQLIRERVEQNNNVVKFDSKKKKPNRLDKLFSETA